MLKLIYGMRIILSFMKELSESQKELVKTKERGHVPPYSLCGGSDIDFINEKWFELVASSKLNQLQEITAEEVGEAIKQARLNRDINRKQLSGILGISQDTLKFYEEGKRMIPFDVYYKLIQVFELDIGILQIK